MSRWARRIEITSNIAILFVAIAIGAVLVRDHGFSGPRLPPGLRKGDKLAIKLPQPSTPKTLVLALSTTCHFCSQNAPFYQSLSHTINPSRVHLIALFPQEEQESRSYLREKNIAIEDVHHQEFRDISVDGTPTLILLDDSGKVLKSWIGVLDKKAEESVIQLLKS